MKQPLVSILIPCYNHSLFLEDCMQSILMQEYSNIEVIVCDDCSKDDSWKKLQIIKPKMEEKLHRFLLIRNENNLGITKTLNKMLSYAQGELIKIIASDDMFAPNSIVNFVKYMNEHDECDVAVSNGYKVKEETHYPLKEEMIRKKMYSQKPDLDSVTLFERLYRCNFLFAPGVIIRKKIYEIYGGYDETLYAEDWEFWLRITLEQNVQIGFINKELVYYRINGNSITSMKPNDEFEQRRIKLHKAEMSTVDKYGKYVNTVAYEEKRLDVIIKEMGIAKGYHMRKLNNYLTTEMKKHEIGKRKKLKIECIIFLQILKLYLKQVIKR